MLRQVVGRDLDPLARVHFQKLGRRLARVVRRVEGQVKKEWRGVRIVLLLEELDGGVRPQLAAVDSPALSLQPVPFQGGIRRVPVIVRCGAAVRIRRGLEHTTPMRTYLSKAS